MSLKALFRRRERTYSPMFALGDVLASRSLPQFARGYVVSGSDLPGSQLRDGYAFVKTSYGIATVHETNYIKIGTVQNPQTVRDYLARQRERIVEIHQKELDDFNRRTRDFLSFLESQQPPES